MKFNWGTGIFIFITLFVISMISIIIFSFSQQVNLVTPEYYPKGVKYEDHITKLKNTSQLKEKVTYKHEENNITLSFPEEFMGKSITGVLQFYYVTDFEKDYKYDLKLKKNLTQEISTEKLISGRYIIKIDWEVDNKEYFQAIDINL